MNSYTEDIHVYSYNSMYYIYIHDYTCVYEYMYVFAWMI